jgi:preprotein translocase subunit SecF
MKIFDKATNFDFMGRRKIAMLFSVLMIVVSIGSLAVRGLNFGIDFTGGTLVEIGYPEAVELGGVRSALETSGFKESVVQHFGTSRDVLIRLAPRSDVSRAELSDQVIRALKSTGGVDLKVRRVEFVGPQVGDELRDDGGLAVLISLVAILVYVAFRFESRFAVGSVVALIHDVIITVGFFSVVQMEFDLTVLAAVLAVIGYSLNDTIVVFDRIRENFRKMRKDTPLSIVNRSLNQTLSRTLMTSMTTLLVLVALFFIGGELIHSFATALIIGIFVGTYSSIYIASSAILTLGVSKADLISTKKDGAELDARP